MRKIIAFSLLFAVSLKSFTQPVSRPRLVVGVVIDQMRWDYLYRYYDRYDDQGGFKRLLNQGFSCENTMIPYAPTVTACGHSTIYTGAPPAVSGITGNMWWDRALGRSVYCTEDNTVNTVGSPSPLGKQSPHNMLVTTIGDELRLSNQFRSKVIGVAIKDRGGILPAGHSANAAYWYDATNGNWISSTYYMKELPGWVSLFNSKKQVDKYYKEGWELLYPASTYTQSTEDDKAYEGKPFGKQFPYNLDKFTGKDYSKISTTPMGNSLTTEFAMAAIDGEKLGTGEYTDMLAISYSSPDYIGHTFGPNSVEAEDGYLRLDKEIGRLLDYLDLKVGKGQYTFFLSADHGVAHVPEFMTENHLPAGRVFMGTLVNDLNTALKEKYNIARLILSDENYQLHLNHPAIDSAGLDINKITADIISRVEKAPGIYRVFALEQLNTVPLAAVIRKMLNNGYYKPRSGDIQVMLLPGYIDAYSNTGTTHGLWNPYDAHIPLLWYGWGIRHGQTNRETYMTDIAPTLAALLHIQMPDGNTGTVITELRAE